MIPSRGIGCPEDREPITSEDPRVTLRGGCRTVFTYIFINVYSVFTVIVLFKSELTCSPIRRPVIVKMNYSVPIVKCLL